MHIYKNAHKILSGTRNATDGLWDITSPTQTYNNDIGSTSSPYLQANDIVDFFLPKNNWLNIYMPVHLARR